MDVIGLAASEFVRSLNPFYDQPNFDQPNFRPPVLAGSATGSDPQGRDGQASNFLQVTALAGRAISAYSGLPSEINSLLGYLANLSVVGRFASDQFNAFTARTGMIPEPDHTQGKYTRRDSEQH